MKERPILFSGPMVRAILDRRKTMTRRVAVPRFNDRKPCDHWSPSSDGLAMQRHCEHGSEGLGCPYGVPGDRLWVRETYSFGKGYDGLPASKCPNLSFVRRYYWAESAPGDGIGKKRPSIFMPRWASRITLEIVSVRVERVQEITEEDAQAEGVTETECAFCADPQGVAGKRCNCGYGFRDSFRALWDSLNSSRGYGFSVNPWVWVIQFRRVT